VNLFLRTALLGLFFISGLACASQQDNLDKLRKRISSLQQEFDKANESKAEVADDLRDSERAISSSNRALHQLGSQQREANKDLQTLQQRAASLTTEMQSQQAQLGRLLYQQYIDSSHQDYLKLLLNNNDPTQVARDLKYYEYIARERASTLQSLHASLSKLKVVAAQTRSKSAEIAALQAEEKEGLQQLEHDKRSRQQTLQKIAQKLKQQRREIGRLKHNEAQLSQLVEKLAHVLPDTGKGVFRTLKGKLSLPVKGRLSNTYGARRTESGMAWTGWFLSAPANAPVKSIAAGRVVYADWLRGFGNLLIIDHGQGYMSLYGNNETLYKQAGDDLRSGDTIATVGNSGGNEDSGLYFELRFEGKPFNPSKWVRR
jgi:septal ring factor EnvC (AmiA/AmiB activator)